MIRALKFHVLAAVALSVLPIAMAAEMPPKKPSERLSVEHRFLPFSRFQNPPKGTPLGDSRIQPDQTRVRFSFTPVRFPAKNGLLVPSLTYEKIDFNYHLWNNGYEPNRVDQLQSIGASTLYRQPLARPLWSFGWLVSGAIASDFKSLQWSSVRAQGAAFVSRKVTGGNMSFGVALIDNYGRSQLFPAIGFEPDANARHKFTLRIPVEASYFYAARPTLDVGVAARISGMNAEITKPGPFNGKNVAYSICTVGPSMRWQATQNISLSLEGGAVPYHWFKIMDGNSKVRDYDLSTPFFISTSLKLSL